MAYIVGVEGLLEYFAKVSSPLVPKRWIGLDWIGLDWIADGKGGGGE